MSGLLRRVSPAEVNETGLTQIDQDTERVVVQIVEEVRHGGETALRGHAERLGDLESGKPLVVDRRDLKAAFDTLDSATRQLLVRVHGRIQAFGVAQREGLSDLDVRIEGGRAGHRWIPVETVGAYAPGGRYPLPSSVLMTVTPARVAGVGSVWVASPRPSELSLAAAFVAGADGVLCAGGAQAVAALVFGTVSPPVDLVVGPGSKWVTATKRYLYGEVGLDGLAGPSEILVIADDTADPAVVAADLLAQAEHDVEAVPMLVTTSAEIAERVEEELVVQLTDLPTASVARAALANGMCVVVRDLGQAASLSDRLAPEHLSLHVGNPERVVSQVRCYGSVFVGGRAAEAFADYGAGPNHVLPTGGGARFQAGLSVMTFLKPATWLSVDRPDALIDDTARLARLEGLEAHARAALARTRTT